MRNSLLNTVLLYDVMLGPAGAAALDWLGEGLGRISTTGELGRWHHRRAELRRNCCFGGSLSGPSSARGSTSTVRERLGSAVR
jgi:hypothetical protein